MAKREVRSEHVGVRFRLSELARLDRAAEQENLTRSEFIREGMADLVMALRISTPEESNGTTESDGSAPPGAGAKGS